MNRSMMRVKRWLKHGVAVLLFTFLMVGAGAAALSAFAAGISLLSKVQGPSLMPLAVPVQTSSQGQATSSVPALPTTTGTALAQVPPQDLPPFQEPTASTSQRQNLVSQLNQQLDAMHSPVGNALDSGGVLMGQTIEQTFGSVLAGVLKTLFLEQSGSADNAVNAVNTVNAVTASNGQ
ncbi:hypothetical protein D2Q93_05460 [Alicyclobacillaceae bacterium I2511]|nr:hypothetical protein D2Q93_05460 [Alicyclobacillaceae bacterium I2511]